MSDYISRGEAYKAIMGEHPDAHYPDWYASLIEAIPAADVRPVKRGRWLPYEGNGKRQYMCSECCAEEKSIKIARFCYYCGADMRETAT